MKYSILLAIALLVGWADVASAQYPTGARVVVGGSGALVRSEPSLTANCLPRNVTIEVCLASDAQTPGTLGTVLPDAPVQSAGVTWWWNKVAYDNGVTGWSSAVAPYVLLASAQSVFTAGERVQAGVEGVKVRVSPSSTAQCFPLPLHTCFGGTVANGGDSLNPGTLGTVQPDAPVLEGTSGWWSKVAYDNGLVGWSKQQFLARATGAPVPPLQPPTVEINKPFSVVGDYINAPALTSATCLLDGMASAATLQLTNGAPNAEGFPMQSGTLRCFYPAGVALGNHIVVITAVNAVGSASSAEFQFVAEAPVVVPPPPPPPSAP
ncbi:MAG TPA: hypothetical protein VFP27_12025, partial [Mycobacterium sp.]|nr:hypothetical protein [Mycobacterium sp.]